MEKPSLLDCSSDSDVGEDFKINKEYADAYEKWRHKEEYQKLKTKYGDVSNTSSSSESEDDESSCPIVDKSFFKALSLVKSHDSKIYDTNNALLPDSEVQLSSPKEKKPKPMFMKDYERNFILKTDGRVSDSEEEGAPSKKLTFVEEQAEIKKSFADFDLSEDDDDSSEVLKLRSVSEGVKTEEDCIVFLKGDEKNAKESQVDKKDIAFLQNYWNDPQLDEKEKFLRDYFLNANYEEEKKDLVPSYEEITKDLESESEEEAAEFEQKYNFRFEEPDSEFIRRYPRTIQDSLRRKDQRRKLKRDDYAERKKQEKEQRREEIKRLKALKRKEIEEKLHLIKETLGDEDIVLDNADIEGDFDPSEHDRKMKELFSDRYYDVPEERKPSFPEDEDLDFENYDNWTANADDQNLCASDDAEQIYKGSDTNVDADCDQPKLSFQEEMIGATKQQAKKKKKSQFALAVSKHKPVFNPSNKSFEQYFNEYYKLDCEDFVGDLPTRFRYRDVVPNDFGLSVDEILKADDKELNRWCSLKRICQHREKKEEIYDVQAYQKKSENRMKKSKIFTSLINESVNTSDQKRTKKKKQKNNKFQGENADIAENEPENDLNNVEDVQNDTVDEPSIPKPDEGKKKRKKKKNVSMQLHEDVTNSSEGQEFTDSQGPESENPVVKSTGTSSSVEVNGDSSSFQSQRKKRKHQNDYSNQLPQKRAKHQEKFSKSSHRKKIKHESNNQTDKRLQLSDKRLEAYGINPKKFKNKIVYSKK